MQRIANPPLVGSIPTLASNLIQENYRFMISNFYSYPQKHNRSFARRIGKSLSQSQRSKIDDVISDLFKFANIEEPEDFDISLLYQQEELISAIVSKLSLMDNLNLEIGLGMGEHFFAQISANPDKFFIGSEPYLNGVASLKNRCDNAGLDNYIIWPDDINLLLNAFESYPIFHQIYVLFPDPWHKKRHHRKRILNEERISRFYDLLKDDAALNFATDIEDYADSVIEIIDRSEFDIYNKDISEPHEGYIQTKYHSKALEEGRVPAFYSFIKRK